MYVQVCHDVWKRSCYHDTCIYVQQWKYLKINTYSVWKQSEWKRVRIYIENALKTFLKWQCKILHNDQQVRSDFLDWNKSTFFSFERKYSYY